MTRLEEYQKEVQKLEWEIQRCGRELQQQVSPPVCDGIEKAIKYHKEQLRCLGLGFEAGKVASEKT